MRVLAPQRHPGQLGPKRVTMPTSISGRWLTDFMVLRRHYSGQTPVGFSQALLEGLSLFRGQCALPPSPLLEGRQLRLPDRFPVS